MENITPFIEEYSIWSSQEKFKDFSFIPKLSEKKKEKLLKQSKFNLWPFIFGPLYYIYLGMFRGIFYIMLGIFLLCFGCPLGIILYALFSFLLSTQASKNYVRYLKKKHKEYAEFNPDADTPYFNISSTRLIILSFVTGGFYFLYWGYRNWKAVKEAQKDPIFPFGRAFFMSLTSTDIFRSIAHSAKTVFYPQELRYALTGTFFFLAFGLGASSVDGSREDPAYWIGVMIGLVIYWFLLIILILLINKFQKAIHFYCEQKGIPAVKKFTFGEIIMILLGLLLNYETVMLSYALFGGFISGFIEGLMK